MAIVDTSISGSSIENRDGDVFIGIDLPFYKSNGSEGYFASTKITLHSVRNNLINLLNTQTGERVFHPNLGLNLKRRLFEPITTDLEDEIRLDISTAISTWLPFVKINRLDVTVSGTDEFDRNKIKINLTFSLNELPDMLDSIEVEI